MELFVDLFVADAVVVGADTPNQLISEAHVAVKVLRHFISLINLRLNVVSLLRENRLLLLIQLFIGLLLLVHLLLLDHALGEFPLLAVHLLLEHLHLLLLHVFLVL